MTVEIRTGPILVVPELEDANTHRYVPAVPEEFFSDRFDAATHQQNPRFKRAKELTGQAIDFADESTDLINLADQARGLSGITLHTTMNTAETLGRGAELIPIAGAALSVAGFSRAAYMEKIVQERLEKMQEQYQAALQAHRPNGLKDLADSASATPLKDYLSAPEKPDHSATDAMLHTLKFAQNKVKDRATKLRIKALGSTVGLLGTGMTAIGALGAGVGALPGAVISATGVLIGASPDAHAAARAVYKNTKGIKGVDREHAANFIWGLALQKAISDGKIKREDLRDSVEATKALTLAANWDFLSKNEDIKIAENLAKDFLDRVGVTSGKSALSMRDFTSKKAFAKIMGRLKSTS